METIKGALQDNIITLLCYDEHAAKIIRNAVVPEMFEGEVYRDIARKSFEFLGPFSKPVADHLPDLFEDELQGDNKTKAALYGSVIRNIHDNRGSVNSEYVLDRLRAFITRSTLKTTILKAADLVQTGEFDEAKTVLRSGLDSELSVFDSGIDLFDVDRSFSFLNFEERQEFVTGIPDLDKRGIVPNRKEMFLIIAPPKRGKTWGLVHLGKMGLLLRKKVCHISLEMSEERVASRYIQSLFSVSKRIASTRLARFDLDDRGRIEGIDFEDIVRPNLYNDETVTELKDKLSAMGKRKPPLWIKTFPTDGLTVAALNAYLDSLEQFCKFVPDLLIIDYPDLMKIREDRIREETGKIYKSLRGLAVDRNIALCVASQGNRSSANAKVVTDSMVAEDWSKIGTADNIITHSQTGDEKACGLSRLYVSNGRNEEDRFVVVISQAYNIGQFCLDSAMLSSNYWEEIGRIKEE